MTFLYVGEDGKIRFRCQYCGKKVKVSKDAAGKVFKCPRCASVITPPLSIREDEVEIEERYKPKMVDPALVDLDKWKPTGVAREKNREVERLFRTMNRENLKALEKFETVLMDDETEGQQKMDELRRIARARNKAIRQHIKMVIAEYDIQVEQLEDNPMRKQSRIQSQIQRTRHEKREFMMAVRALFEKGSDKGGQDDHGE